MLTPNSRYPEEHASSHQHGGGDEVATATPAANAIPKAGAGGDLDTGWIDTATGAISTVNAGDSAQPGAGTGLSFRDHQHAVSTAAPGTIEPDDSAAEGSATSLARSDHTHGIVTAAPSQGIGGGSTEGSATSFARSDHDHTIRETGGPTNLTVAAVADGQKLERSGTTIVGVTDVFGEDYQYAAVESRTTTTSDTPQVKTTLTTPALTGTYLIHWQANVDSNNKILFVDLYNSTDTAQLCEAIVKPSTEELLLLVSGFAQVTFTGSAKTFQIRWYNESGKADTLGIEQARITIWRVS